jgi:hypothetical protein
MKLIRNIIKCGKCGQVIESKHRHDFVVCKCGNCSVDGGLDYARRVGANWEELSKWEELNV